MSSTTLLLARHGQTVWHAENRYAGVSDIALTDEGRAQAEALGRWAAAHPVDADLDVHGVPGHRHRRPRLPRPRPHLPPEPALRECDFGVVEGRTLAEFAAENPQAAEAFRSDPVAHPFPGAEDPKEATERGVAALRRIARAHSGGRVLVVAHNTLLRLALCELLSIPLGEYRRVLPRLRNAAVTELRVTATGSAALLSLNVPCDLHLP
ncbi:histidine phosphatase family protein [Streptomyces sp. GKU 895]|nr:histidine phosphatase family protein [Streptomyces sp. GKU 895]